jgi:TolB-like protein
MERRLFVSAQSAIAGYAAQTADPQSVGRELGVRHVLVGQVRRLGERVRA